jgi:ethanolamine utilization protein EutN
MGLTAASLFSRALHVENGFAMTLGRVAGTIVATRKDPRLEGAKLLIVKPISPEGKEESNYLIAIDTVQAGPGALVLLVSGSSARLAEGCKDKPVDASIVGIIDSVSMDVDRNKS